jgi:hypothetical protein
MQQIGNASLRHGFQPLGLEPVVPPLAAAVA